MEWSCKGGQQELNQSGHLLICIRLLISEEYQVLDIKITSNGMMEWMSRTDTTYWIVHHISEESCLFQSGKGWNSSTEQSALVCLWKVPVLLLTKKNERSRVFAFTTWTYGGKKDQLHNDVLCFLKDKDVSSQGKSEANTTGKQFVKMLVNVFWYVDISIN